MQRACFVFLAVALLGASVASSQAPQIQLVNVQSGLTLTITHAPGLQDLDPSTFQFFSNGFDVTPYYMAIVTSGHPSVVMTGSATSVSIGFMEDVTFLPALSASICTVGGLCASTMHKVRDTLSVNQTGEGMPSYAFGNGCLSYREYTLCAVQVGTPTSIKEVVADGFKTSAASTATPEFVLRVFSSPAVLAQDCPPEFGNLGLDTPLIASVVGAGMPPTPGAGPVTRLVLTPANPLFLPAGNYYVAVICTNDEWNWCEAVTTTPHTTDVWAHWGGSAIVAPYQCTPPPTTWCLGYAYGTASMEIWGY